MGRMTIDFGIDLGTTNSVIAVAEQGEVTVIKNSITQSDVTPSAVMLDKRGTVTVGQNAYQEIESYPDNAVREFKRWMGNGDRDKFHFIAADRLMSGAELSSEILKSLKADATERFGNLSAAVITVPAIFPIPACEDTKKAARLAGIEVCPLLQEPVAAAIAYGYKVESLSGNLLVFDLGGGTFDTSVLTAKEGRLVVLGHDGDNKLGGKNYDQAIVELIIDRLSDEYDTSELKRGNPSAEYAIARLMLISEDTKKFLSRRESHPVAVKNLGRGFDHIDSIVTVTRNDVSSCTARLTERCIDISERLLTSLRLPVSSLEAVLVVGGGTLVPSVRSAIEQAFAKTEHRIDPMTVVAVGAALFASTQRINGAKSVQAAGVGVGLKLAYSPVAAELDADIGIVVTPVRPGMSIGITRADKGWSSGAIQVPADGRIMTTVALRAKKLNAFHIHVRDAQGTEIAAEGTSFSITHGLAVAKATTSTAFSVALVDNQVEVIIPKGTPLPAKGTQRLLAAHIVKAGDPESVLNVYALEGDNRRSDRNLRIAELQLCGKDLKRSIPAGETVEITYRLDESKTLSVEVLIPALGEVRTMKYEYERPEITPSDIEIELAKERKRIGDIRQAAPQALPETIEQLVAEVESEKQAAGSDPDTAQKAAQRILEIKQELDQVTTNCEWDLLMAKYTVYAEDTKNLANAIGTDSDQQYCSRVITAAEKAIAAHDTAQLRDAVSALIDIFWKITFGQDEFWKDQFQRLSTNTGFVDPLHAERLKEEGFRALKRNDIATLQTIVWDLFNLLPTWQQGKLDERFADAGLTRAQGAAKG